MRTKNSLLIALAALLLPLAAWCQLPKPGGTGGGSGGGGGGGDVTAASSFGTDNVVTKSDGTGKGVQSSGVGIDDSDNMTVPGSITTGDGLTAGQLKLGELEANGSNSIGFTVPDDVTTTLAFKFPDAQPTAGQLFSLGAPSAGVSQITFVDNPGASIAYGSLSVSDSSTATTINTVNVWEQYTDWDATGPSNNTTPSTATDDITISEAGTYIVVASISFSGSNSDEIEMSIEKNNGATNLDRCYFTRKLGVGGDVGSASISCLATLAESDTVELWMRNTSDADDVTIEQGDLLVAKPGSGSSPSGMDAVTATGTWTRPAGVNRVFVRVWGAGGGGGGANAVRSFSGGGGGGYAEGWCEVSADVSVTVGAGGAGGSAGGSGTVGANSVFGTCLTATGGEGGISGGVTDPGRDADMDVGYVMRVANGLPIAAAASDTVAAFRKDQGGGGATTNNGAANDGNPGGFGLGGGGGGGSGARHTSGGTQSGGAGGPSGKGGAGGAGADITTGTPDACAAGSIPGGGGGSGASDGAGSTVGCAGGNGRVEVWY